MVDMFATPLACWPGNAVMTVTALRWTASYMPWPDNCTRSTLRAMGESMAEAVRALVVKESSGTERIVPLEQGARIIIGRDASSTIRLDSPYVSRPHARIEC